MEIHPITTAQEYDAALRAIEALWEAPAGSPEAEQLEILVTLVEAYEATHHPIDPPDPIDAITFRMEQGGLSLQDLEVYLGRHAADVLALTGSLVPGCRYDVSAVPSGATTTPTGSSPGSPSTRPSSASVTGDDGRGIDPQVLLAGRDGHWGLPGMRERAERVGARLRVWSRTAAGTEVELSVPNSIAFESRMIEKLAGC